MTVEQRLEALEAKVMTLEDQLEIQKLMSKYSYWLFTQKFDQIKSFCWSKAPDISIEASDSGLFIGQESVMRFFSSDGVVGAVEKMKGIFTLHIACDPIIDIAPDGKSAKSVWLSPGCTSSMWIWGVFVTDYIKEDGQWKMWHSNFSPLFRTKYDMGWIKEPISASMKSELADAPPTRWNPYNKEKTGKEQFGHLPEYPFSF